MTAKREPKARGPKAIKTEIVRLDLRELELLELNARFMRHETYQQLVENLRRDGALTSVPFAVWNAKSKKFRVLSGNHRVQAAIDAGIVEADVMVTKDKLGAQREVAIQLAHNAIAGEDDPSILKQLYDRLEEVDWRAYSGLDDKVLELIEDVQVGSLSEAALDWQVIAVTFLPEEAERAEAALKDALEHVSGDKVWLARWGEYDRLLDALAEASTAHAVSNQATAFAAILGIYERHRDELVAGFLDADGEAKHKGLVPLSSVVGTTHVPAPVAAVLKQAVERMVGRGDADADKPWRVLEFLAAEYLAGP